jgi:hypothetical protein
MFRIQTKKRREGGREEGRKGGRVERESNHYGVV